MNKDLMFSSKTDLWETPQDLFDRLDSIHHFTLDVCATPDNAKCNNYYTPEIDGLSQKWGVLVGVIHLMAGISAGGLKKHITLIAKWLCFFRREQTQNGFTIFA